MTFERAAREHIDSRGSKETRAVYLGDLGKWLTFCELEKVDPNAPPFSAAIKFRDALVAKYADPSTRRTLSVISVLYEAAGLVNHFKSSRRLHRPKPDDIGLTDSFTREQIDRLLEEVYRDPCYYAIVRLLYDTGLRIAEVLAIKRAALYGGAGLSMTLIGKVKKQGRVQTVVPETAARAVTRWLNTAPSSDWLFPASRGAGPMATSTVRAFLSDLGKRTEVDDVRPHRFRATFATNALDAGIALHEVQAAMHHSDPKTTQRYDRGKRGAGVTNALAAFREKK